MILLETLLTVVPLLVIGIYISMDIIGLIILENTIINLPQEQRK